MAALDRVGSLSNLPVPPDTIKRIAGEAIWRWFDEHKEDVVATILFYKVRVKDLEKLFERITGRKRPANFDFNVP